MNDIHSSGPTKWQGDMCFGILSTKSHSTTLTASSDGLILAGPLGKTFKLPHSKVRLVETGKTSIWFLSGRRTGCIQFHHDVEGVPKFLLFSAKGISALEVAQQLKELGYEVPNDSDSALTNAGSEGKPSAS
ncbi:MAG: hypothetical protein ACXWKG_10315 [Limisphaerales bacterium]